MFELASYWFWVLSFLLFYVAFWYLSGPKNLPPGSSGIPLLGYLPFLEKDGYISFSKLKKKFGNVFHLYLGNRLVIVLNDYEAIKEAFVKQGDIFAGRPPDGIFQLDPKANFGIVQTDGEYWKQHRRFLLTNLRDFGVGKQILEPLILNEIQHFLAEVKKSSNTSFPIKPLLTTSIANNIHYIMTAKRYEYGNPLMKEILRLFELSESVFPEFDVLMFFPWLANIPGSDFITKKEKCRKLVRAYLSVITKIVNEVEDEYKEGEQGIYVHAYMTEKNLRSKTNSVFTDEGLVHITRDMLSAGTDTTATTLHWALLYMTAFPECQKKIHEEIDQVVGRDREPSYNDRTSMPFTEATILELHRVISLVPLSLPHRTLKDTQLFGHHIPKNAVVFPNLWAVHNDIQIWGDPEKFRPERFITKDGQFEKSEQVMAFSIGKRACAGEPLARMEVFLYFVSLLQHFTFIPPDGIIPSLNSTGGFARRPEFQNICPVPHN